MKSYCAKKLSYRHSTFFISDSGIRKLRDRNSKESLVKGTENLQLNTFTKVFLSYKYNCSTYLIECNPLNKSAHFQTTGHALQSVFCAVQGKQHSSTFRK